MKKLKLGYSGLGFAKVINDNASELGTQKNIKFENMTPFHFLNTLNEQINKVDGEEGISFKTGSIMRIYNDEVGNYEEIVEPVVLSKIEVTTPPTKITYDEGDELDLTGLEVLATYSDGSTKVVTEDCTTSPANEEVLTAEDDKVTISYTEGQVTETVEQAITVE